MYYVIADRSTNRVVHEHFERVVNLNALSAEEFLHRHCDANELRPPDYQCIVLDQPRLKHFEHGRYLLDPQTLTIHEDPLWRAPPRVEREKIPSTDLLTGETNV